MKRVLVINDCRFERNILRDLLINLGYEVETTDEYATLSLLESCNPDIVIANMNMTDISGDRLIQNIKGSKPATKCYLSSCSDMSPEYSQNRWIDGLIKTPINTEQLLTILEEKEREEAISFEEATHQSRCDTLLTDNLARRPEPGKSASVKELPANYRHPETLHDENDVKQFTFCPYCGNTLSASSGKYVFCPFCGTKL